MKRFLVIVLALLVVGPLGAIENQPLEMESLKIEHKDQDTNFHFYLGATPLLSIMPGVRWQNGQYGMDANVIIRPYSGWHNASISGLLYLNPNQDKGLKHYLSAGASVWMISSWGDDVEITPATLISYGFEKKLEDNHYLFMNFGVYTVLGRDVFPFPLINIGYAF